MSILKIMVKESFRSSRIGGKQSVLIYEENDDTLEWILSNTRSSLEDNKILSTQNCEVCPAGHNWMAAIYND